MGTLEQLLKPADMASVPCLPDAITVGFVPWYPVKSSQYPWRL